MKVLNITTHLNSGGITVYILRLVDELRSLGIEYSVLSSGGNYESFFRDKNCPLHTVDIKTKNAFHPKIFLAIPKVIKIIKKENYDIIHAHTRVAQVLSFFIQRFIKIPVVTTAHGFYKVNLGRRILPAWGDYCIAISDPVAKELIAQMKTKEEKIRLIHNAVDMPEIEKQFHLATAQKISQKKTYGFEDSDKVLGVVARLVKDKGHEYLLEAFRNMIEKIPSLKLLIVGDGREFDAINFFVKKNGLEDKIKLTGNISNVPQALSAIDIFVFPATWREGFGLSIVEAMACEKPVIVTDIWALNSWIENKKTGLLIAPKDPKAIEDAVLFLLNNPKLRDEIGKNAKELVIAKFTLPRMAREVQRVYNEALTAQKASL